ncbi:cellulose biosynthesis protein BcsG [Thiomicrorhabdus sp.]|uniref:cellulose biosynthesis protein BcsG n=1 Tax=Thiomicrorhabdus sp. TaxID=2039724 RepID=UPI0029C75074|nr:cellulose biosynthesis protein BcsG [Thiomicrorhabdus sp.]
MINKPFDIGAWNLFFLAEFIFIGMELINFNPAANLLLLLVLLIPITSQWIRIARAIIVVPSALILLYTESWLPPINRLIEGGNLISAFSLDYVLELTLRYINTDWLLFFLIGIFSYWVFRSMVRFTFLTMVAVSYLSILNLKIIPQAFLPATTYADTGMQNQAKESVDSPPLSLQQILDQQLADFYEEESTRIVNFSSEKAQTSFDIIFLQVCSLSWSDLQAIQKPNPQLLKQMDILFTNFNSATSYSGPAAIRLLRANCGQTNHHSLFSTTDEHCYLFNQLETMHYRTRATLNHTGEFDDFNQLVRKQIQTSDKPLQNQYAYTPALKAFDGTPIWRDYQVLENWYISSAEKEKFALFYNTITLHDGNRFIKANGKTVLADYPTRFLELQSDIERFISLLQKSTRKTLLVLIPEHGAALHGDKMQLKGIREFPSRSITHVPVGMKLINFDLQQTEHPIEVTSQHSYLAIAELIERLSKQDHNRAIVLSKLAKDLPQTKWVSETQGTVIMEHEHHDYIKLEETGKWQEYR